MAPIVLSIGTTHPWNVAGVGRDLVVGSAKKCRVFTAVAAVSAQNAAGVIALGPVAPELFEAQLSVLPWESAGAVRVGALPTSGSVRAVARALEAHRWLPAVVDPVFAASSGGELADREARDALEAELATLSSVILTPNLREPQRCCTSKRSREASWATPRCDCARAAVASASHRRSPRR